MLKYIIYGVIILFVLYKGRNYIKGWVLDFKKKRQAKNDELKPVNDEYIYSPVLSSRVFTFSIEVSEVGGGKAKISVIK
jgi:hypothetical protein